VAAAVLADPAATPALYADDVAAAVLAEAAAAPATTPTTAPAAAAQPEQPDA